MMSFSLPQPASLILAFNIFWGGCYEYYMPQEIKDGLTNLGNNINEGRVY
jgi:hypothetical protein